MPKFKLIHTNQEVEVPSGSELLEIARKHPELTLKFGCRQGQCGVCALKVIEGQENLTKMCAQEKETLQKKGLGEGYRLACQCALNDNVGMSS